MPTRVRRFLARSLAARVACGLAGGLACGLAAGPARAAMVAQGKPELQEGKSLTVALGKDHPRRELRCAVRPGGVRARVRIFAHSGDLAVRLRVTDAKGVTLGHDAAKGSVRHAFVGFDFEAATELRIEVAAHPTQGIPEQAAGSVQVRFTVSRETAATLKLAARIEAATLRIRDRFEKGEFAAARRELLAADASVAAEAGADESPALLRMSGRIMDLALRLGELDVAARCAKRRRDHCLRTLPPDHAERQRANGDAAQVARARGDAPRAQRLLEEVVETFERTLPPDHPHLDIARSNLALVLVDIGDLSRARRLQELVVAAFERRHPKGHPRLWTARQNLAATLQQLGQYRRAKELQESVARAWQGAVPDDHPALQTVRLNLAGTLDALGDRQGALALAQQVVAVRSRTLPPDHPRLQSARTNLAAKLCAAGDYAAARALLEKVVEIHKKTLPEEHTDALTARENLAIILALEGKNEAARALFAAVVAVRERTQPGHRPDVFQSRVNLATAMLDCGQPAPARTLLERALAETRGVVADSDPFRTHALVELARCLAELDEDDACKAALQAIAGGVERRLLEYGVTLTPRRCAAAVVQAQRAIGAVLGSLRSLHDGRLDAAAFRAVEAARGLEASAYSMMRRDAGLTGEQRQTLQRCRTAIALARHRIATLARAGSDPARLRKAVAEKDRAAGALRAKWREIAGPGEVLEPVTPESIGARLAPGEAAVSYWRDASARPAVYHAWIVARGGALHRVGLGPAPAIDAAAAAWRETVQAGGDATRTGRRLRELLFDPLLPHVEAAKRLYVAADGVLHLTPLAALPERRGAGQVLGDRFRMTRLHSLRSVGIPRDARGRTPSLLVLGGVDYGAGDRFAPLGAARREVAAVQGAFAKAFRDASVTRLTDAAATKQAFATAAAATRYLHVATHAWFAPESVKSIRDERPIDRVLRWGQRSTMAEMVRGFSPMVLCGLALAGANDATPRGILTAEELAGFDLSRCDVAVLSGCETSLGLPRSGQGLASLSTALHIAGVRVAVTSLWAVPDRATRKLMAAFYENLWVAKLPPDRALWRAQRTLRDAKDARGEPLFTAVHWAGWLVTTGG